MDTKKTIHIALGLDSKYVMQCGVAITSICENNKEEDLHFHIAILEDGEHPITFQPLIDITQAYHQHSELIPIKAEYFEGLPELTYISKATYLRLLLPKVLNNDIEEVLYVDSDIIVLGSLRYFAKHPLGEDFACGAAIDVNGCTIRHHNRLGIPIPVVYFNAGILQMNLNYWRRHDISQKALQKIAENQYWFMDQDAINVVLNGHIKRIPYQYNLQTSHFLYSPEQQELDINYHAELKEAMENPIIIHYASYRKPWQKGCPKQEYWLQYKKMTQWASCPLMKSKPNDDTTQELMKKAYRKNAYAVNTFAPYFFKLICKFSKILPK